jgi:probable F420-dependent oxidoreductase
VEFAIALAFNDPGQWTRLACAAEDAGFGALVVSDHLVYPRDLETPYPYTPTGQPRWGPSTPWPDPLISIAAMGAVTNRIKFLTSVYILPLRHPLVAAKQVGTTALFAGGRLILGVGAGWMREEFDLVGAPFAHRGRRMLEAVEVMRKLWRGGMVEHQGEYYSFPALEMAPALDEPVPVWGGGTSDVALRRAATCFDGWASEIQSAGQVESLLATLNRYRQEAGRDHLPFGSCVTAKDVYDLDGYRSLSDLGVSYLITVPWALYRIAENDVDLKCEAIRRFADEVLAPLGASA